MTSPRLPAACVVVLTAVAVVTMSTVAPGWTRAKKPAPTTTTPAPTTTTWAPLPAFNSAIEWADCGNGFECGTLTVPVDWRQPSTDTVPLAVIRHPASTPDARIGALVVNPGGPGFGGTPYLRAAMQRLPGVVKDRFDLVSWDPRGTGSSRPLDCVDDAYLDLGAATAPVPDSAETLAIAHAYNAGFASGCTERNGAFAGQVGTRNTARDLEAIRIALGEPKLNYLGFSYGTVIGATYAQMFPTTIRTMVLDGPLDLWLQQLDYTHAQAAAFVQALDAFLAWCEGDSSCALRAAGAPRDVFNQLLTQINATPMPAQYTANRETRAGSFTGSLFETAVISMLYDESRGWPILARSLRAMAANDAGPMLQLADNYLGRSPDGTYGSELEANAVINCVDHPESKPRSAATELADILRFQAELPPWGGGWALSGCTGMPKPAKGDKLGVVSVTGAPPILVVGTTGDPATPYAGAVAMVAHIAGSELLTFESTEHTAYGTERSNCIDEAVDAYLVDGVMPPAGTRCSAG
jgi:pimeloyl-ACP methyl ester carboxylesterase